MANLRDLLKGIQSAFSTGVNNLSNWTKPSVRQDFTKNVIQPPAQNTWNNVRNQLQQSWASTGNTLRSLPDMVGNQINIQKRDFAPGGTYNNAYQTIKQNPVLTPSFNRFEAGAPALIRQINPLKPQTPQQNWQDSKKVGAAALTAYGMAKVPVSAVLGGATIGPVIKMATNVYSKKPLTEGVVDSISEGAGMGLANSGTTRLTNWLVQSLSGAVPVLKPLTEKAISEGAPVVTDTIKQGVKKLINTAGKRFIKAAVIETAVESPIWATFTQKEQESYVQALTREVGENLIMNVGMAGVQVLGDSKALAPIISKTVKDIVNNAFTNPDGSLKMRSGKVKAEAVIPAVAPLDQNTKPIINEPITSVKTEAPIAETPKIVIKDQLAESVTSTKAVPIKTIDSVEAIQTINDAIKSGDIEGARNLHETFSQETKLPAFDEILKGVDSTQAPIVAPKTSSEVIQPTDIELKNAQADVNQQTRGNFDSEQITLLNKVKAMLNTTAYKEGDIETLRKDPKKAKEIQMALETVWSTNPSIKDEQGALDFIKNLPTAASTKKVKSSINDQQYQAIVLNSNDEIYATAVKNGGITIDLDGRMPSQGYSYSPYKGSELILDKNNFTVDNINQFKELNADKLVEPGNYLGIWEEEVDGVAKMFLDVSKVGPPTQATVDAAEASGQLGVFDLENFVTIYTKLSPNYEKTNRVDINQGEGLQPNLSGSEGSNGQLPKIQDTTNGTAFGNETSGTSQKVEKPIPMEGEAIRKLPLSMERSPLVVKQVADAAYDVYDIKPNEVTISEAENIFNRLGFEESKKMAFNSKLNVENADVVNVLGIRLLQEAQNLKNWDEAIEIAKQITHRATLQGRAVQIWSVFNRFSPEGLLKYTQTEFDAKIDSEGMSGLFGRPKRSEAMYQTTSEIKDVFQAENTKALDEIGNEINSKFGGQMTVPGTESVSPSSTKGKVGSPEQTTSTGKTKTGVVFKGKKSDVEVTQEKMNGVDVSTDPEKSLANRIRNYVKDTTDKKKDPIREMVNTLFVIAKETLPEKVKKAGDDPMEVIANALNNKSEYKSTWNEAKQILEAKYGKNSTVMGKIEKFLTTELTKPFPEEKFNAEVGKGIKENDINLAELVKKYYTEVGAARQTLSDYLVEKAGLTGATAKELEGYVTQRFGELTSTKKQDILDKMLAPVIRKPKVRQDVVQQMIEYSNLGGFNQSKYYEIIANKLGLPVLDAELAKTITENMQKVQALPKGRERDDLIRATFYAINKKIGLTGKEMFTAFRYQNILSGFQTQGRNIGMNAVQQLVVRPATLTARAILDIGRKVTQPTYERQVYFSDIPKYYKDIVQGIPQGLAEATDAMKGIRDVTTPDISAHKTELMPNILSMVTRFMEASDKLFQGAGSKAESKLLIRHGMDETTANAQGLLKSSENLFRKPLDPQNLTGQGGVLSMIDGATMQVSKLRRLPGLGWFIPFITTPMNVAKQWIEYNPATTVLTMPGNKDIMGQLSKQLVGSVAMSVGALAAIQGRTTWTAPTDPKERELWYATSRKPYSFNPDGKVNPDGTISGGHWIPMNYFSVLFPAFALPAALRDKFIDGRTALSDSTSEKLMGAASGMIGSFADQTFLTGLSNWIKVMTGDTDYSTPSQLAFTAEQMIPLSGAIRWINTLIDPRYIDSKGNGTIDTIVKSIQKDTPFLSKSLPAYQTPIGEDSKRETINSFLPYAIGTQNDIFEAPLSMRSKQLQQNAVTNKMKKEADSILADSQRGGVKFGQKQNTAELTLDDKKLKAIAYTFGLDKVINMPDSSSLEKISKREEAFKSVEKIMDSEYPSDVKSQLYEAIGLDAGTAQYYSIARKSLEYRTALVAQKLEEAKSTDDVVSIISAGLMPVNNKKVVTTDLITNLYKQGIISSDLQKYLKKLEYNQKTGQVQKASSSSGSSGGGGGGGGGGLKVPFPTMPRLAKTAKMTMPKSTGTINTSAIKSIRSPFITIKTPKLKL